MDIIRWPGWRFGPGGLAAVFERAEDVPAGWVDSPARVAALAPAPADEFATLDKAALELIARDRFGVELDRRLSVDKLRTKVRELAGA